MNQPLLQRGGVQDILDVLFIIKDLLPEVDTGPYKRTSMFELATRSHLIS